MAKKILIITGSPRGNANSTALALKVAEGAESIGAKVDMVDATELDFAVAGCKACDGCKPDKLQCALEDDIADLMAEFPKYDSIIFATPIYFFSFPAQLKIIIDRMYSLMISEGNMTFTPLKKVQFAVVATGAGDDDDSGIEVIREQMGYLEELIEGSTCKFFFRGGCSKRNDMANNADALADAVEFGTKIFAK